MTSLNIQMIHGGVGEEPFSWLKKKKKKTITVICNDSIQATMLRSWVRSNTNHSVKVLAECGGMPASSCCDPGADHQQGWEAGICEERVAQK